LSWHSAMKRPIPTREEERALLHRFRDYGDRAALAELVERNSRAVYAEVMGRRAALGWNFDDCMVEGMLGLQRAAEKFDLSKGVRFGTYARWWVRAYIRRWLCGMRMQPTLSLDAPVEGLAGEKVHKDRIAGEDPGADVLLLDGERRHLAHVAVDRVGGREGEVLRLRLLSEDPPTLDEVGKLYGISRERARQIEKRGKAELHRLAGGMRRW
jgi:RNA polymerase primary sigma factor